MCRNEEGGEMTYKAEVHCFNCDHKEWVEIPKGTMIGEFTKDRVCDNCGCPMNPSYPEWTYTVPYTCGGER